MTYVKALRGCICQIFGDEIEITIDCDHSAACNECALLYANTNVCKRTCLMSWIENLEHLKKLKYAKLVEV